MSCLWPQIGRYLQQAEVKEQFIEVVYDLNLEGIYNLYHLMIPNTYVVYDLNLEGIYNPSLVYGIAKPVVYDLNLEGICNQDSVVALYSKLFMTSNWKVLTTNYLLKNLILGCL